MKTIKDMFLNKEIKKMITSLPVLFSFFVLTLALPFFVLLFNEHENNRRKRLTRILSTHEDLALNGWIMIVDKNSPTCADLIRCFNQYKKFAKCEKFTSVPVYDISLTEDVKILEILTKGTTSLNSQFINMLELSKGKHTVSLLDEYLPIIYNVGTKIYHSLPKYTNPQNISQFVVELEKNHIFQTDMSAAVQSVYLQSLVEKNSREQQSLDVIPEETKEGDPIVPELVQEDEHHSSSTFDSMQDLMPDLVNDSSSDDESIGYASST